MPTDADAETDSDAIPEGQPSTDEQKPSKELEALQEAFNKAADEKHSKLDKAKSKAEKTLSETKTLLTQLQKEREEEQVQLADGDPDKLTALQLQKKLRERDDEIERMKLDAEDLKEQAGKATEVTIERDAEKLAEKYGIDSGALLTYGGGTVESMTELAKILAKNKPTQPDITPDSGLGGGGASEDAQLAAYAAADSDDHEGIKKLLDKYRR